MSTTDVIMFQGFHRARFHRRREDGIHSCGRFSGGDHRLLPKYVSPVDDPSLRNRLVGGPGLEARTPGL
ncbi:hypothetical protein CRUP_022294 [Coryphaenoides rupestris]|nr:hypothetical protein CRUP_022294 [Coryphaenoides rupestris]